MAMPRSSAAAITSSSRTLPPGWMTAAAPASASASRPSRNGKKASEATTEPLEREAGVLRLDRGDARAVDAAHLARADAERHAVARRTRSRWTSRTSRRARRTADRRSAPRWARACVTVLTSLRSSVRASLRLHEQSAAHALVVVRLYVMRRAALRARARSPSSRAPAARRAPRAARSPPRRTAAPIASAVAASSGRLKAMMPPNADVGSVLKALRVRGGERSRRPPRRTDSRA